MSLLTFGFAVVLIVSPAALQAPTIETLEGTIIDSACYLSGGHGAEDRECTEKCIENGVAASLLTKDGDVVLLLQSADYLSAFEKVKEAAAEKVKVTGLTFERGGMKGIVVVSVQVEEE